MKKIMIKSLLAAATLGLSSLVMAGGSFDLSLSDDSARFEYDATKRGSGLHVAAGYLHNEISGDAVSLGFNVVDVRNRDKRLYLGVGGKFYGFATENEEGGALGVGGFFRYQDPELNGIGFGGQLYYAPDVVAFGNTENFIETDVRIEYSILPTARVYAGLRLVRANMQNGVELDIDRGGHFGLRIDF